MAASPPPPPPLASPPSTGPRALPPAILYALADSRARGCEARMWCLHRSEHGHGLFTHAQPATERRRQAEAVAEARQGETRSRGSLVENTGSESGGTPVGARVRR